MKYTARFAAQDPDLVGFFILIPVSGFEVDGGASRTISLKTATDISITSELEQARMYKNITLYVPGTKDHSDMETAIKMSEAASSKKKFLFSLWVERDVNKNRIEGLVLRDNTATVQKPPSIVKDNLMALKFSLPAAKLQAAVSKHDGHVSTMEYTDL